MVVQTLVAAALLAACGGPQHGSAVSDTDDKRSGATDAQKGADLKVVELLSSARCDQEDGCKNIGPGAKYAGRDVCLDQMRGSIGNDLNAYSCPRGLDSAGVDRCMAAIKSEECSHPFQTLSRYDTCRNGALCMN